jgi:hypothetical protein
LPISHERMRGTERLDGFVASSRCIRSLGAISGTEGNGDQVQAPRKFPILGACRARVLREVAVERLTIVRLPGATAGTPKGPVGVPALVDKPESRLSQMQQPTISAPSAHVAGPAKVERGLHSSVGSNPTVSAQKNRGQRAVWAPAESRQVLTEAVLFSSWVLGVYQSSPPRKSRELRGDVPRSLVTARWRRDEWWPAVAARG